MRTPLCTQLGITFPLVQAPMAGGWTTPELASAVSETGALGMLAAARLTADQLRQQIVEVQRRTRRPFGVNFLIPAIAPAGTPDDPATMAALQQIRKQLGLPEPTPPASAPASVSEGLEIALDAKVPIISFAMATPAPYTAAVHAAGAVVIAAATTVADAQTAQAAGADIIVAQGSEAGGHRSTFAPGPLGSVPLIGTMALLPAVVDAVTVPVLAAGGIMDGRGIVAALALGAQGVQMGTRFLLARESGTPPGYRQRLLQATEADTVVTDVYSGRAARGLSNAFVRHFTETGAKPMPWPRQGQAANDLYRASYQGDGDWAPLFAGQGLRLARQEQPAADIVRELMDEAKRVSAAFG